METKIMEKISGVYKITNKITGDFYIGSSKNIMSRWYYHKAPSIWTQHPGMKLYQAIVQYGLNNFKFEIVEETSNLKEREQYWIDLLQPVYNIKRANGIDIEQYKEYHKAYREAHKDYIKEYQKERYKAHRDEILAKHKEYVTAHKAQRQSYDKEYINRLCLYNGKTLTLNALRKRLMRRGIPNPLAEARKYLIQEN